MDGVGKNGWAEEKEKATATKAMARKAMATKAMATQAMATQAMATQAIASSSGRMKVKGMDKEGSNGSTLRAKFVRPVPLAVATTWTAALWMRMVFSERVSP